MNNPLIRLSHDRDITLDDVQRVSAQFASIELSAETSRLLDARREETLNYVDAINRPAYGFNRGFGHNVALRVERDDLEELQTNLIRSHSSGIGPPAPIGVVRATMVLRAQSLARGHSAVRSVVVQQILDFLNNKITPVVPSLGSVSASGDLAPLSHIALSLIGEGNVIFGGSIVPAREALDQCGLVPLALGAKEGLALNNGVQYSTAIGVCALEQVDTLLRTACIASALSAQAMLGSDTPFRADLHRLRPHSGAQRVAGWIFELMQHSPLREFHRSYTIDGEIQDPYNVRCAAQILGTCSELIERARRTLEIEANSVTDNPIILQATAETGWHQEYEGRFLGQYADIVSGGHFHGMPVAVDLYGLMQAVSIITTLVNARCVRYVDEARNRGLGSDVKWPGPSEDPGTLRAQSIASAMMIPEYATASLTNFVWGQCMPSHLMSLSTDAGQEDHVSMAANVGLRLLEVIPRAAEALAIELAFASQAAAIRKEQTSIPSRVAQEGRVPIPDSSRRLNAVGEALVAAVQVAFPLVKKDRSMSEDIGRLAQCVARGDFVEVARSHAIPI